MNLFSNIILLTCYVLEEINEVVKSEAVCAKYCQLFMSISTFQAQMDAMPTYRHTYIQSLHNEI